MSSNKKTLYLLAITCLFLLAWIVVLELTQQRVQLEGENKLANFKENRSPFVWTFDSFTTDVVSPYQKFWQVQKNNSDIVAKINSNPILSLNFSGEKVNTGQYNKLKLNSHFSINANLVLQIKISHEDDVLYYSEPIVLSSKKQTIDLDRNWIGVGNGDKNIKGFKWGKEGISSLVLQFSNPENRLNISSVELLPSANSKELESISIDCKGQFDTNLKVDATNRMLFILKQTCWLPSNYMWLKDFVGNYFPGSVLILSNKELLVNATNHMVNRDYSKIVLLNVVLYLFVFVFLFVVYLLVMKNKQTKKIVGSNNNYSWAKSYSIIIGVSLSLILIMSIYKTPDFLTFKMFPMYFIWALFQQFILCYLLAEKVFYKITNNKGLSSLYATTIFSLFHLPSITLAFVTFIAGFFWSYAWLKYRRMFPLALSHTVLALMFYYVISERLLYSARIFQWFWQ